MAGSLFDRLQCENEGLRAEVAALRAEAADCERLRGEAESLVRAWPSSRVWPVGDRWGARNRWGDLFEFGSQRDAVLFSAALDGPAEKGDAP